jgi:hypothetical protein
MVVVLNGLAVGLCAIVQPTVERSGRGTRSTPCHPHVRERISLVRPRVSSVLGSPHLRFFGDVELAPIRSTLQACPGNIVPNGRCVVA